jgi:hypothetical protein
VWLDRYRWWGDATARLFRDEPATKLDGQPEVKTGLKRKL